MFARLFTRSKNRPARVKVKRIVPENGPSYEQFNFAVLLAVLVYGNYVFHSPSPTTSMAISWLLGEAPLEFWRVFLAAGSTVAVVCSYNRRSHAVGLSAMFLVGFVWCGVLLIGWLAGAFVGEFNPPAFASAVLYGAFARQAYSIAKRGR